MKILSDNEARKFYNEYLRAYERDQKKNLLEPRYSFRDWASFFDTKTMLSNASSNTEFRQINKEIIHSQRKLLSSKQKNLMEKYLEEGYDRLVQDYGEEGGNELWYRLNELGYYEAKDKHKWVSVYGREFGEIMASMGYSWEFIFNS